ncbi:hypothetical protein LOK49_LG06G01786 [Camellia lanceoleosa]|uniref:Uncharacterized protein n=1 Tax=Camellia lanceoleosa TaxID=1840588 RepID=A0ACC0HFE1_9ERIC|nr:hypothetical protein LOK49_LG06G01786 [Camellia lanceoleosa]
MDSDSWTTRLLVASRRYQSRSVQLTEEVMLMVMMSRGRSFFVELCCHIDEAHPVEAKNGTNKADGLASRKISETRFTSQIGEYEETIGTCFVLTEGGRRICVCEWGPESVPKYTSLCVKAIEFSGFAGCKGEMKLDIAARDPEQQHELLWDSILVLGFLVTKIAGMNLSRHGVVTG